MTEAARPSASCSLEDGCITCGDVAVPLTVVEAAEHDARCRDEDGREEIVAVDLVGAVAPGDRLLVHAGVALERLPTERGASDAVR
jgi:hydrogenase expression/formation protein HypC